MAFIQPSHLPPRHLLTPLIILDLIISRVLVEYLKTSVQFVHKVLVAVSPTVIAGKGGDDFGPEAQSAGCGVESPVCAFEGGGQEVEVVIRMGVGVGQVHG